MKEIIIEFLKSKEAKRFYWSLLNITMAFVVSLLAYLASQNVAIAITILPIANGLSQMLTKFINKRL
jgi:hypothetical protein